MIARHSRHRRSSRFRRVARAQSQVLHALFWRLDSSYLQASVDQNLSCQAFQSVDRDHTASSFFVQVLVTPLALVIDEVK
jgi:hypothetical protein